MQTTSYRQQVAAEIRAGLARRNLTRTDLASVLRMSPRTLGDRLTGKSAFDLDEIQTVADFLRVSVVTLVAPERAA